MARKNPTITSERKGLNPVNGMELPLASGVSSEALEDANKMPGHGSVTGKISMSPNDGDNPSIPGAAFATGKDGRNKQGGPSSDPYPAMPGC